MNEKEKRSHLARLLQVELSDSLSRFSRRTVDDETLKELKRVMIKSYNKYFDDKKFEKEDLKVEVVDGNLKVNFNIYE